MSVQFGRWNFDGLAAVPEYIEKVDATLAPYGPDSDEKYLNGGVTILYRAFHTTRESHREMQPHVTVSGAVITWDGRLDNRAELIGELRGLSKPDSASAKFGKASSLHDCADVDIVAGAYEKWGMECFGRLIGDWALSIWNPRECSVLLAKDPIGTKRLYYSMEKDHVAWCTILEPLVLYAGHTFRICEEYIANWLATMSSAPHLTPYVGISVVPPSCCVLLRIGKHGVQHTVRKYWDFDPGKCVRYRTDAEYEEHFRDVFATAVQRRLRSDRPMLAELSGGMDSSSIVCMADLVIARGEAECPRLDTISWYHDSLPNWGEIPHFTKVEEKRHRVGHHIDVGALKEDPSTIQFGAEFLSDRLAVILIPNSRPLEYHKQYSAHMESQGHRVTLCGIGGDEVTGSGVTPTLEFQNLLSRRRFATLFRQLNAWAAKMRKPRLPLLWEAIREFFPLILHGLPDHLHTAFPWLNSGFVRRNRAALHNYPSRLKLFGPLPSFQRNLHTLAKLLADGAPQPAALREVRFPYLDRVFLEFMYAIPREQIVGVGQGRFLMKRALVGIVPNEILNRRIREGMLQYVPPEWPIASDVGRQLVCGSLGIIDSDRFWKALQEVQCKENVRPYSLRNTLTLESWLRHLGRQGVLSTSVKERISLPKDLAAFHYEKRT